jgi:hypothetical protein
MSRGTSATAKRRCGDPWAVPLPRGQSLCVVLKFELWNGACPGPLADIDGVHPLAEFVLPENGAMELVIQLPKFME